MTEELEDKIEDPVEFVGQAIGEASMCWSHPEKAGEFDSDKATEIRNKILSYFSEKTTKAI